jgi:hypothetical protein
VAGSVHGHGLDPPKPRTDLVTRGSDKLYVVKWAPPLTRPSEPPAEQARPAPTPKAESEHSFDDDEASGQPIWTRARSSRPEQPVQPPATTGLGWQSIGPELEEAARGVSPPSEVAEGAGAAGQAKGTVPQAKEVTEGPGRAEERAPEPEQARGAVPVTDAPPPGPAATAEQVTISQVLSESLAQAKCSAAHLRAARVDKRVHRCGAAQRAAGRRDPGGGTTSGDHHEAHSVDPARPVRRSTTPTGAVL